MVSILGRKVSVLDFEGLLLNGMVRNYRVAKCGKELVKIVAELSTGEEIETPCFDEFRLRVEETLINYYMRIGEKITIKGPIKTFVMEEEKI